jgi:hypothetical protein
MIYGVVGTLDRDTMMKFGLFNIKTGRFTRPASKKGNGKTMVLVYYGYREHKEQGRKIYSNFHTAYSIYRTAQEIFDDLGRILDLAGKFGAYGTIGEIIKRFDKIFADYPLTQVQQTELYELRALYFEYFGSMVLLTEFQKFFNSLGTSTKTIKWIEGILTQLRKLEIDLMWDSQRPISAGNRSREYTETYLVPQKFHLDDGTPCDQDICDSGPDREHFIKVFSDVPFRDSPLCELVCSEVGKYYETNEIIGDNLCSPVEKEDEAKEKTRRKSRDRKAQEQDPAKEKDETINAPSIDEKEEYIRLSKTLDEPTIRELYDTDGTIRDPIEEPDLMTRALIEDNPKAFTPMPVPQEDILFEIPEPDPEDTVFEIPDLSPFTPVHLPNDPPDPKPDLALSAEETESAIDDLEMKMLAEAPFIPVIIKDLLLTFKQAGRTHELFSVYFNEDGSPKLSDQLEALHKEVTKAIG